MSLNDSEFGGDYVVTYLQLVCFRMADIISTSRRTDSRGGGAAVYSGLPKYPDQTTNPDKTHIQANNSILYIVETTHFITQTGYDYSIDKLRALTTRAFSRERSGKELLTPLVGVKPNEVPRNAHNLLREGIR